MKQLNFAEARRPFEGKVHSSCQLSCDSESLEGELAWKTFFSGFQSTRRSETRPMTSFSGSCLTDPSDNSVRERF